MSFTLVDFSVTRSFFWNYSRLGQPGRILLGYVVGEFLKPKCHFCAQPTGSKHCDVLRMSYIEHYMLNRFVVWLCTCLQPYFRLHLYDRENNCQERRPITSFKKNFV